MSQPVDPFEPPSGAVPAPPPAYGAYAAPAATPAYGAPTPSGTAGWTPAQTVPAGLATATVALACVWTALEVVALTVVSSSADTLSRAQARGVDPGTVMTPYDAVGTALFAVQVAAFVVGCLWLARSRRIAEVARPFVRHARGPVWVWLGWVVPVVSLWFPYQVVRDVRAGTPRVRSGGLGWWWFSWLLASWLSNQSEFTSMGLLDRDPATLPLLQGVVTVATVVAAVQWIRIVREVTAGQRLHAEGATA